MGGGGPALGSTSDHSGYSLSIITNFEMNYSKTV